ncbi:MAG: ParB-like protein [Steroidobacterales bacterium]
MAKIQESPLRQLMPTQLTVGMIEVRDKTKQLLSLKAKDLQEFLIAHPMPVVMGPDGRRYITDHHHLGRAALDAGIASAFFSLEADLSKLGVVEFWQEMDRNRWVHPLDENGVRHHYASIPPDLKKMVDDVYRSLAAFVRNAGGYDKTTEPFAEFIWADFFRRTVPIEDVKANFNVAVETGIPLAQSQLASRLPGFRKKK